MFSNHRSPFDILYSYILIKCNKPAIVCSSIQERKKKIKTYKSFNRDLHSADLSQTSSLARFSVCPVADVCSFLRLSFSGFSVLVFWMAR